MSYQLRPQSAPEPVGNGSETPTERLPLSSSSGSLTPKKSPNDFNFGKTLGEGSYGVVRASFFLFFVNPSFFYTRVVLLSSLVRFILWFVEKVTLLPIKSMILWVCWQKEHPHLSTSSQTNQVKLAVEKATGIEFAIKILDKAQMVKEVRVRHSSYGVTTTWNEFCSLENISAQDNVGHSRKSHPRLAASPFRRQPLLYFPRRHLFMFVGFLSSLISSRLVSFHDFRLCDGVLQQWRAIATAQESRFVLRRSCVVLCCGDR